MKGVYCLLMLLDADSEIQVGALGSLVFPKGVYVYIGSAQGGVEQRVRRHLRKAKKPRWHIDYLLESARVLTVVSMPTTSRSMECSVARSLSGLPNAKVVAEGFGSSDCHCESHLLHFEGEDADVILEMISGRISMGCCPYPEIVRDR